VQGGTIAWEVQLHVIYSQYQCIQWPDIMSKRFEICNLENCWHLQNAEHSTAERYLQSWSSWIH